MLTAEKEYPSVIPAVRRNLPTTAARIVPERVAEEIGQQDAPEELATMTAADFVALVMGKGSDENKPNEKYPPLIQELSGIIHETDLERISREDERVRYILRDGR